MIPHHWGLQLHASFLFNFNPLLPSGETQSQALIVSSFTDHGEAQEENLQSLHKPHTGVQTKAVPCRCRVGGTQGALVRPG